MAVVVACLLAVGACTHSQPNYTMGTGGSSGSGGDNGSSGTGGSDNGSGGSGGLPVFGTGGSTGTGGTDNGTGGATTDASTNDAPAGDADNDAADDQADAGASDGGAVDQVSTDDAGFPIGAAVGTCIPFNWTVSASNSAPLDPPGNAVDGVATTRWSTGVPQAPGLNYQIDFGGFVQLSELRLDTGGSPGDYPRGYQVMASSDNFDFSNVIASDSPGDVAPPNSVTTIDFPPTALRGLIIQMTGTSGSWWSIHELTATCHISDGNGGLTTDLPTDNLQCTADLTAAGTPPFTRTNWTLTASSTSTMATDVITNAIDGLAATRWSSGVPQAAGQFFKVDLGSSGCVGHLEMTSPGTDFPNAFVVSVSADDNVYIPIAKGVGVSDTTIALPPHNARYVRIDQTGSSGSWWSINELTIAP
ncbi:MAG TPA: discoidin domain-containing protein [Polyangia bacterium]|jgi:hypothetical protein|nr:discoidin domain-containing protein [Polyangia bacterium]